MVDVSSSKNSITITVGSANKNNSVAITPSTANNSVTTKSDTAQYWSNQSRTFAKESKDWANKLDGAVDGIEYSAKHYANLANSYVEGFEDVATNNTNNIIATSNDFINQITETANTGIASVEAKGNEVVSTVNEGIANINTAKTEITSVKEAGVQEINTAVTDGKTEITTTKDLAIDAVNTTKTTILNDIEFVADGEKQEIQELADEIKDNAEDILNGHVSKSGDTMTGDLGIAKSDNTFQSINCVNQNSEIGVIPTETVCGSRLISYDKNNYWYATVQQAIRPTTGDSYIWMTARNASGDRHAFEVRAYPDGTGGCYLNNKNITSLSMPTNKYTDLTLGASGSTYTAPANGWVMLAKKAGVSTHTYIRLLHNASGLYVEADVYGSAGAIPAVCLPVKKGDIFTTLYGATGETSRFRFVYAEGDR